MAKYQSPYSPDKEVTAAQYIIEKVCEKKAEYNKTKLPIYFWRLPEWAAFFKSQLRRAHALLKVYNEKAIIRALQNPKARNIYSLYAPWLEDIIKLEMKKIEREKEVQQDVVIKRNIEASKPRKQYKKNRLDFLDE